jgi:putative thiamine transport system substrate-binding protein
MPMSDSHDADTTAPRSSWTRKADGPQLQAQRRRFLAGLATAPLALAGSAGFLAPAWAQTAARDWSAIEKAARGQTVFFNAWAGSDRINAYLQWAAAELRARHGVELRHVKITDAAEVVQRVRTEKAAGRADGSVDMLWINGENFHAMKREGLLFGPWSEQLPAYAGVDTVGKPTTRIDFSEPVDGLEAPWGMAQLTFFADAKRVPQPPRDAAALLQWARANPGRFTYPRPPQFHGTTFLKQMLSELNADRAALYQPMTAAAFARLTPPLWQALDALHPLLWREGRQFPASEAAMRQMLADGELAISFSFNPNEAASEIAAGRLPAGVQSWQHVGGTIGNTHFLAIAFNARAKEGAQVAANFLLSPLAQARKADIRHWGDPTVLALSKLAPADRAAFDAVRAPGMVAAPAPALPEPHASWVDPLEREWARRYSV